MKEEATLVRKMGEAFQTMTLHLSQSSRIIVDLDVLSAPCHFLRHDLSKLEDNAF